MAKAKVVVVTGASRGLGLAIATEFAANGWQVIGTGRSEKPADLPASVDYRQFDASDSGACESLWSKLHDAYPDADICLVNNASSYVTGSLLETKPESYEQEMQGTYLSAVYMTHGLASHYGQARIINIISTGAPAAHKNNSAHGAAKAAEMHFFQSLQQEFSPSQYQISNLYPNNMATGEPNPKATDPKDVALLVRELADNKRTYYLRDASIYPTN